MAILHPTATHLHHLTYERRGKELLEDVRLICLKCHGRHHPKATFRPLEEQQRIARARRKKFPKYSKEWWRAQETHARNALRNAAKKRK